MENENNVLKVKIFGTEYPLKVNANIEHVKRVASYVDKKMLEIQSSKPNRPIHQIAILACLNITDELIRVLDNEDQHQHIVEARVKHITEKLELGLQKNFGGE